MLRLFLLYTGSAGGPDGCAACVEGDAMFENKSAEVDDFAALETVFGGPLLKRSMMLSLPDCGGGAGLWVGGVGLETELPPPRMSANRSAVFCCPFGVALESVAGKSD